MNISTLARRFSQMVGLCSAAQGGTGLDASAAAAGKVLVGTGTGFALADLAHDGTIAVTAGAGTLAIGVNVVPESQVAGLTAGLALKAPLASPAFTGTPTAPTAAGGANTTQVATTQWVTTALAGTGLDVAIVHKAGNETIDGIKTFTSVIVGSITGNAGGITGAITESQVTGLAADLALKAPLASPALTGVPTAPTAAQGTNTTQVATTAGMRAEIAALVNSAPSILDTLGEITTALQADESTAATLATTVAGKQPLDSTLTALAAYSTNGLLTQTSPDTFAGRTLTQTANQVLISNADGVSGNPTFSLPQSIHSGASPTFGGLSLGTGTLSFNGSTLVSPSLNYLQTNFNLIAAKFAAGNGVTTTNMGAAVAPAYFNGGATTYLTLDTDAGGYIRCVFAQGGSNKVIFAYNITGSDANFGVYDYASSQWILTFAGDGTGDIAATGTFSSRARTYSPIDGQSGTTYTPTLADNGATVSLNNAGAVTFTVPPNTSVAFPVGAEIGLVQLGAGSVAVAQGAGVTVHSYAGLTTLAGRYAVATLKQTSADVWILAGNLA